MKEEKDYKNLNETQVFERLTENSTYENEPMFSETQVFEKLTDASEKERDRLSETMTMETMTDPLPVTSAEEEEGETESKSALREILLFIRDLGVCMAIVLVMVNFVIRPVQVEGTSMIPTLSDKAIGVSNLLGYRMDGIKRNDIVIIYIESSDKYLVKRAVGLPGDTISCSNETLYINGEPVDQEYLDNEYRNTYEGTFTADFEEITLGDDEYYCLGDNRPRSSDSRFYGPFHKSQIVSKGVFILFPFSSFGAKTW